MLNISKRLKTAADFVIGENVADIGSDHGILAAFLAKTGRFKKIIATDINAGPLSAAQKTVTRYGLENIVETRLCAGLSFISVGEADTIVIAGMGGALIQEILSNDIDVAQSAKRLVLQPQDHVEDVRRYLHNAGFRIEDETVVCDNMKFYNVIVAEIGEEQYTDEEYFTGRKALLSQSPDFAAYIAHETAKRENILRNITRNAGQAQERCARLMLELEWLQNIGM